MSNTVQNQKIAWAGWSIGSLPEWRPMRITGDWRKGSMMIGTANEALMQISWWRPERDHFDAKAWALARAAKDAKSSGVTEVPGPSAFSRIAWVPERQDEQWRSLWYGYADHAGLVLEIATNKAAAENHRAHLEAYALPTLAATSTSEQSSWSVFGSRFVTPRGFAIEQHRMTLGDISLNFRNAVGDMLLLRQMYPAKLMLTRRPLSAWIGANPFPSRLRHKPLGDAQTGAIARDGEAMQYLWSRGVRRLRFPLGFIGPRNTIDAACHDDQQDRLLIVSLASRYEPELAIVSEALAGMGRAIPEASRP